MPDYRVVADSEVQPDAPVTSSLGFALRDNPAAIAQGALNAPKVRSEGLNLTSAAGDRTSDGVIFTLNGLDRVLTLMVNSYVSITHTTAGNAIVRYRTSTNGGSTWSGYTTFDITNLNAGGNNRSVRFGFVALAANVNSVQFDLTSTATSAPTCSVSVLGIRGVSP